MTDIGGMLARNDSPSVQVRARPVRKQTSVLAMNVLGNLQRASGPHRILAQRTMATGIGTRTIDSLTRTDVRHA